MSTKPAPEIDRNTNDESSPGGCMNRAQSRSATYHLRMSLRRLGTWLVRCFKAHEDRILSLRVYSQHRLDRVGISRREDT